MNRLQSMAVDPSKLKSEFKDSSYQVEQSVVSRDSRDGVKMSFFAPLHYEKNYQYPLIAWLHGPGGDERQLQRVMPQLSMRNYVSVGPRGIRPVAGKGFDWQGPGDACTFAETAMAEHAVLSAVDAACERYNIDSNRVFLAGLQSGGTMAFRLSLAHPGRFGGALSFGGCFPQGQTPLKQLQDARNVPLFIAHCRDSQTYSLEQSCEELRLFHVAGMNVTLRQYPCDDELTTKMLEDADSWIMEHVTGQSASDSDGRETFFGQFN